MADFETNIGAEELEVADPTGSEDVGAEEQDVADPVIDEASEEPAEEETKTDVDSKFAEMRRKLEEAERVNAEYEAALSNFFPEAENKAIAAEAYYQNRSYDDVFAEKQEQNEIAGIKAENEQLRQALLEREAEQLMANGLREIQAIDPTVTSLEDLGDDFASYIASGLTTKQAYFAHKAQQQAVKVVPPKPTGKVEEKAPEPRDYFTQDEVEAMSQSEIKKNFETIRKSMDRW